MIFRTVPLKIQSCALSDVGLVRKNNEDAWGQLSEDRFFVLADGMGGHNAGEIAAQESVKHLCDWREQIGAYYPGKMSCQELCDLLEAALCVLNRSIYQMGTRKKELKGMGTTICCLFFHENSLIFAHVGDSRIYRFRDNKLEQMTEDHSLLNELVERGKINNQQAEWFVYKNVITRAIGVDVQVEPEVSSTSVLPGDVFFMCSDGLSDYVSKENIEITLKESNSIDQASDLLVKKAKEAGGFDNITILMTKVE
jgi:serine/threonine protein phosphatase PrpC